MRLLGLSLWFLAAQVILGFQATWNMSGPNMRYMRSSNVYLSNKRQEIICANACSKDPSCASFNHNSVDNTCELMNATNFLASDPYLVAAPGWSHYNISSPRQAMQERLCPPGMVFLPYDLPPAGYGYNLTVQGYTCSSHAWILKQQSLGKTDCRMVLMYNLALYGYDYSGLAGVGPYDWVFQQCLTHPCASVTCYNQGYCYLKSESHISSGVSLTSDTYLSWYAYCQ